MDELLKAYDKDPVKVNTYSIQKMKLTLKDTLKQYLDINKKTQDFKFTDLKLFINLLSSIIGLVVLGLSNKYEQKEKTIEFAVMISMFLLSNVILYLVEGFFGFDYIFKGILIGKEINKGNKKKKQQPLKIYLKDNKYDDFIKLQLFINKFNNKSHKIYLKTVFFDDGKFDHGKFIKILDNIFYETK